MKYIIILFLLCITACSAQTSNTKVNQLPNMLQLEYRHHCIHGRLYYNVAHNLFIQEDRVGIVDTHLYNIANSCLKLDSYNKQYFCKEYSTDPEKPGALYKHFKDNIYVVQVDKYGTIRRCLPVYRLIVEEE